MEQSPKLPSLDIGETLAEMIEQVASVSFQQACALQDVGPTKGQDLVNTGEWESYLDGSTRKITLRSIKARRDRLLAETKATTPPPLREGLAKGPAASLAARQARTVAPVSEAARSNRTGDRRTGKPGRQRDEAGAS